MTLRRESLRAVALVAAGTLGAIGVSCGGAGSPSTSTPPPVVSPQPTPPPAGGGGIIAASCSIGQGEPDATCGPEKKGGSLLGEVETAMDLLIQQKPQIFDLNALYPGSTNAYMVLDRDAYFAGLVANLQAAGLCAERDYDDPYQQTLRVKNVNTYSEDFDVLLGSGHMRRGKGAYRQTCAPASFPVDRPTDAPPLGSGCYRPYPPPVTRFKCKVHLKAKEYYTLDSTPLVGPDLAYCTSVGFKDMSICPIRPEGTPDRAACENWRVGKAKDTGRPGPTWTKQDGSFCNGPASGCANTPDGQYQLWAYLGGTYRVAGDTGSPCEVIVQR